MKKKYYSSGQTMVEMVVATGMVALVLVAIVAGVALSIRNSRFSRNKAIATRYAQETLEKFRALRDEVGWRPFLLDALGNNTAATYCFPTLPDSAIALTGFLGGCTGQTVTNSAGATEFVRSATSQLSTVDTPNDTVEINVTVSWIEGSKTHQVLLTSKLNSWEL